MQHIVKKVINYLNLSIQQGFLPAFFAIAFMLGISFVALFNVSTNLTLWTVLSTLCLLLCVVFYIYGHRVWLLLLILLGFLIGSFVYTYQILQTEVHPISHTQLNQVFWVDSKVEDISSRPQRSYIIVKVEKIFNLHENPKKLRLSIPNSKIDGLTIGDQLTGQFYLQGISAPAFPEDFDFLSYAKDKGFQATGYLRGDLYITKPQKGVVSGALFSIRQDISKYLVDNYKQGGVLSALSTAMRGYIDGDVRDNFQSTGLAHLLAISGMHLGFIAAFVFFVIRGLMSAFPKVFHKYPSKKIAAVMALFACWFYAALAGFTIPTIRAAILLSAFFLVVLLERQRLQMRILSYAVIIVLFIWPSSLFSPSFQMSFSSAAALILFMNKQKQEGGKIANYFKLIFTASLIAGVVTMPLAAYHFSQVSLSGFLANLVAVPVVALFVLPCLFLGLLLSSESLLSVADYFAGGLVEFAAYVATYKVSGVYIATGDVLLVAALCLLFLSFLLTFRNKLLFNIVFFVFCSSVLILSNASKMVEDRLYYMQEGNTYFEIRNNEVIPLYTELTRRKADRVFGYYAKRRGLTYKLTTDDYYCQGDYICLVELNKKRVLLITDNFFPQREDCQLVDAIFAPEGAPFTELDCYDKFAKIPTHSRSAYLTVKGSRLAVTPYPK